MFLLKIGRRGYYYIIFNKQGLFNTILDDKGLLSRLAAKRPKTSKKRRSTIIFRKIRTRKNSVPKTNRKKIYSPFFG